MALKMEYSVATGLATAAVVYGIYQNALPTVADIRSLDADNRDIAGAERGASWLSAAVVAGVSLIAKDPTIFTIGGAMVVGMAWLHRHANAVQPATGTVAGMATPRVTQAEAPQEYATPTGPTYDSVF